MPKKVREDGGGGGREGKKKRRKKRKDKDVDGDGDVVELAPGTGGSSCTSSQAPNSPPSKSPPAPAAAVAEETRLVSLENPEELPMSVMMFIMRSIPPDVDGGGDGGGDEVTTTSDSVAAASATTAPAPAIGGDREGARPHHPGDAPPSPAKEAGGGGVEQTAATTTTAAPPPHPQQQRRPHPQGHHPHPQPASSSVRLVLDPWLFNRMTGGRASGYYRAGGGGAMRDKLAALFRSWYGPKFRSRHGLLVGPPGRRSWVYRGDGGGGADRDGERGGGDGVMEGDEHVVTPSYKLVRIDDVTDVILDIDRLQSMENAASRYYIDYHVKKRPDVYVSYVGESRGVSKPPEVSRGGVGPSEDPSGTTMTTPTSAASNEESGGLDVPTMIDVMRNMFPTSGDRIRHLFGAAKGDTGVGGGTAPTVGEGSAAAHGDSCLSSLLSPCERQPDGEVVRDLFGRHFADFGKHFRVDGGGYVSYMETKGSGVTGPEGKVDAKAEAGTDGRVVGPDDETTDAPDGGGRAAMEVDGSEAAAGRSSEASHRPEHGDCNDPSPHFKGGDVSIGEGKPKSSEERPGGSSTSENRHAKASLKQDESPSSPSSPRQQRKQTSPQSSRKPAFVVPTTVEEAVHRAVSVVAAEIESGVWWCAKGPWGCGRVPVSDVGAADSQQRGRDRLRGYTSEDSSGVEEASSPGGVIAARSRSLSSLSPPTAQLLAASSALTQFANDVIIPSLISQGVDEGRSHRAFLATCIMLRETLIVNAAGIFYPPSRAGEEPGGVDDADGEGGGVGNSARRGSGGAEAGGEKQHQRFEVQFTDSILATALMFSALRRLDDERQGQRHDATVANGTTTLCEEFAALLSDYQTLSGDFSRARHRRDIERGPAGRGIGRELPASSLLPPLDVRHGGVMPNGKPLSKEENMAWRISYNLARDKHPLGRKRDGRLAAGGETMLPPQPNACIVYMVEDVQDRHEEQMRMERHNRMEKRRKIDRQIRELTGLIVSSSSSDGYTWDNGGAADTTNVATTDEEDEEEQGEGEKEGEEHSEMGRKMCEL